MSKQYNDFEMSNDFIGWNLFISKYDWDILMSRLGKDEKKLLSKQRISAIYKENKDE
jgi:hypothetical protein